MSARSARTSSVLQVTIGWRFSYCRIKRPVLATPLLAGIDQELPDEVRRGRCAIRDALRSIWILHPNGNTCYPVPGRVRHSDLKSLSIRGFHKSKFQFVVFVLNTLVGGYLCTSAVVGPFRWAECAQECAQEFCSTIGARGCSSDG
jgi:hypothetical protein